MDYLTVLSTLRVELFVARPSLRLSAPGSLPPLRLAPVTMSLLALIRDDTYCAFFLLDRILEGAGAHRLTFASSARASAESRAAVQAAEVTVWEEICRAKSFARTLGCFFEGHDRVTERELGALAASHGIGLALPPGAGASSSSISNSSSSSSNNEHRRPDVESVRAPAHGAHAHAPAVAPVLV